MSRNPNRSGGPAKVLLIALIALLIAATGLMIWLCIDLVNAPTPQVQKPQPEVTMPTQAPTLPPPPTTEPPTTAPPEPERVVATATVASQGDLLMHKPVFETCRQSDGSYDFSSIFRYSKDLVASYDYAVANLETTFGGDKYIYQGNPAFNCPDALADSAVETGYDMLLTANNHAGDTMGDGILRTIEHIRSKGMQALGSQLNNEEPKYSVVDINGIKIGMVCYTWAFSGNGSTFSLNGLNPVKDEGQMNYFTNNNPDKLYKEAQTAMEQMKATGAEATMLFIHWGQEYQTTENALQNAMAQKLCDIGYDVIVGGHPHVVQPVELLQSTQDPDHKTICIYSLGNAVSNQRTGISTQFPAGYTEDGALFTVTFEKYSDGKVYLAGTEVVPTWVNMHSNNGAKEYNILPLMLDQQDSWTEQFGLTSGQFSAAQKSYDRTMGIVGEGLEQCQSWLEQAKLDREAYYADLAANPAKYQQPVQTQPEQVTQPMDAAA